MKTTWDHGWLAHEALQRSKGAFPSTAIYVVYGRCATLESFVVSMQKWANRCFGVWWLGFYPVRSRNQYLEHLVIPKGRTRDLQLLGASRYRQAFVRWCDRATYQRLAPLQLPRRFWSKMVRLDHTAKIQRLFRCHSTSYLTWPEHYVKKAIKVCVFCATARARDGRLIRVKKNRDSILDFMSEGLPKSKTCRGLTYKRSASAAE